MARARSRARKARELSDEEIEMLESIMFDRDPEGDAEEEMRYLKRYLRGEVV